MPTQTFPVKGMSCASCVRHVEKALASTPGVKKAFVNLAAGEAIVNYEGDPKAMAEAVKEAGYELLVEAPGEALVDEIAESWTRMVLAIALTIPLLLGMIPGIHLPGFAQFFLATPVVFGAGRGFFMRAMRQALHAQASMDTLIALGSATAWGFGAYEWMRGAHHLPFETAAALVAFLLVGKHLEAKAKLKAGNSLRILLSLAPSTALKVETGGRIHEVPVESLELGDRVRVLPGQAIPVDGEVLWGQAEVEEALLTGEPLPVPRGPGDRLIAGAVVQGSALELRVDALGRDTLLARMSRLVDEAQSSKAPAQDLADRLSAVFVPVVLALGALSLVGWWIFTGSLGASWRPAVTLLVIACPCALGLATPVALTVALGSAARKGVLVRDAAALEALSKLTDLAFDKTGTLTEGKPMLRSIQALDGSSEFQALALAAALERDSTHPLAMGIRQAAQDLELPDMEDFRTHTGGGISGTVAGRALRLGSAAFLGLPFPEIASDATAVGLAEGERLMAVFILGDRLRAEAAEVVAKVKAEGIRLHLLSGDRPEAAEAMGRTAGLGLDSIHGGLSPEAKLRYLQAMQKEGRVVGFVGDGANDAPALAQADCGVAIGELDAAQAVAPLNLLRPGLDPLLQARKLAQRTNRIIKQNLAWAFGYNLLLIPLAAFGQLERFGGPMLAGAAMGLSSLTVVLNALRLRK